MEEIESLKAKVKVVGKTAVQYFIDYLDEHPLYDTLKVMLKWLREVHLTLDIFALEAEFKGPTGGRPNIIAAEALQEARIKAEVGDEAIVSID